MTETTKVSREDVEMIKGNADPRPGGGIWFKIGVFGALKKKGIKGKVRHGLPRLWNV